MGVPARRAGGIPSACFESVLILIVPRVGGKVGYDKKSQRCAGITPSMLLCRCRVDPRDDKIVRGSTMHTFHRNSRLSHSSDGTFRSPDIQLEYGVYAQATWY